MGGLRSTENELIDIWAYHQKGYSTKRLALMTDRSQSYIRLVLKDGRAENAWWENAAKRQSSGEPRPAETAPMVIGASDSSITTELLEALLAHIKGGSLSAERKLSLIKHLLQGEKL